MSNKRKRPIHDVAQFMRTFKVGDTFWTIESMYGEPVGIQSHVITGFEDDKVGPRVASNYRSWGTISVGARDYSGSQYVSDVVNDLHGVCLTKEAVEAYLEKRKKQFALDPEAQKNARADRRRWEFYHKDYLREPRVEWRGNQSVIMARR